MGPKSGAEDARFSFKTWHGFQDECLIDAARPPIEHVALFDEAQRAWDRAQTPKLQKKHRPDFDQSKPEFQVSGLDRHRDWAVIVCLVGGGQELNTGEMPAEDKANRRGATSVRRGWK